MTLPTGSSPRSASSSLERLAREAIDCVKKARRHRRSLTGDNFYANKLATLRADATNAYRLLNPGPASDVSPMAGLIDAVFSPSTPQPERTTAYRELFFNLRTKWHSPSPRPREDLGLFPLSILEKANRSYLVTIGRQMNGCFGMAWYDGAAVMMRRLVEVVIIEAFEGNDIADKIRGKDGNYLHLTQLVGRALTETKFILSRNAKTALPKLRDAGHLSAHGRHFTAAPEDLEKLQSPCRIVVEEFLRHAGLL